MPDFLDWQHYIGGTLDSKDKASRIRALNLLKDKLTLAPGSLDVGDHSITYSLIEALANRVVNDPAERCRELSLTIINECLRDMDPEKIVMTARCIVPAAAERFGSQPFREPVEELRLKLIEICTKLLLQAASELSYERSHPITDILTFSLISALTDTFPAGKRAAAMAISNLCRIAPWSINLHFVALIIELSTNLSHQHAKTRLLILDAIVDVTCVSRVCNALPHVFRQIILPGLGRICMDRSKTVRVRFACSLGAWLVRGLDKGCCTTVEAKAIGETPGALHEFASDLLALLFMLLSDESQEVAARAVSELNAVGIHWELATSKSISKWCVAELPLSCVPSILPRDFACNAAYLVSSAATTLVTLHFQPILNIQLVWLSCWMPPMRAHNLHALAALITTSGAAVNILPFQVGKLVQTYGDWISDDNEGVQDGSRAAIRALSAVLINHSPALNIVLDAGAPPLQAVRDNSLVNVTLELLRRASTERIASSATTMVTIFCHLAEACAEQRASCPMPTNADAADTCFCYAVRNLLRLRIELDELALVKLMRSLLLLPSFIIALIPTYTQVSPSSNYMVNQSLVILLAHFGHSSRAEFVQSCFDAVIGLLPKPNPCYESHTVSWLLLSALVHICPGAVASVFDNVIAPIFLVHVHPYSNPNPEVRIKALR